MYYYLNIVYNKKFPVHLITRSGTAVCRGTSDADHWATNIREIEFRRHSFVGEDCCLLRWFETSRLYRHINLFISRICNMV
jgi:hypothetical protein